MDAKKVGQFLKELRKEQNMTQEQLGEKVGTTNKTVSKWENGNYMPPIDVLLLLSDIYNISINEILSGRRLNNDEYKQNAEDNMKSALEKLSVKEKRISRIFISFLLVSSLLAITIFGLVSRIKGYDVSRIIIIVLVLALTIIANTFNMCLYVSEKDKL